jgi:Lon-like ATP-dependent protease
MIAVNRLKNSDEKSKGFILLLNGPPGVGKTSIAKSIGKCLKRTQRFISFAGVTDPHFFKGHRRTYVDSQAGVFIKELIKADTLNPVFILDEVDKMAHSS